MVSPFIQPFIIQIQQLHLFWKYGEKDLQYWRYLVTTHSDEDPSVGCNQEKLKRVIRNSISNKYSCVQHKRGRFLESKNLYLSIPMSYQLYEYVSACKIYTYLYIYSFIKWCYNMYYMHCIAL